MAEDHLFAGQKSNAPGIPGVERKVTLRISSAGTRIRQHDVLQLRIQNETSADVTNEVTYRTKDRHISVTASGLIHSIGDAGPFSIEITDAAGGTAVFTGEVFAG